MKKQLFFIPILISTLFACTNSNNDSMMKFKNSSIDIVYINSNAIDYKISENAFIKCVDRYQFKEIATQDINYDIKVSMKRTLIQDKNNIYNNYINQELNYSYYLNLETNNLYLDIDNNLSCMSYVTLTNKQMNKFTLVFANKNNKHKINSENNLSIKVPTFAYENQILYFDYNIINDVNLKMYVNDDFVYEFFDNGEKNYLFYIMPNYDVNLEFKVEDKTNAKRLKSLYTWMNDINIDNLKEVEFEFSPVAVGPGNYKTYEITSNQNDLKEMINMFDLLLYEEDSDDIFGGYSISYIYKLNDGKTYSLMIDNDRIFANNSTYKIHKYYQFTKPYLSAKKFITYKNKIDIYDSNKNKYNELKINELVFNLKNEINISSYKYYGITDFGEIYIYNDVDFAIKTNDNIECYSLVNNKTFQDYFTI